MVQMGENQKSRRFWESIISIIVVVFFFAMFPILGFVAKLSISFLPGLGNIPWWIAYMLLAVLLVKTYYSLKGELDRRFPPFGGRAGI
jgi:hypothetical protein